eukprot:5641851-Amphidinium_carterae.1
MPISRRGGADACLRASSRIAETMRMFLSWLNRHAWRGGHGASPCPRADRSQPHRRGQTQNTETRHCMMSMPERP